MIINSLYPLMMIMIVNIMVSRSLNLKESGVGIMEILNIIFYLAATMIVIHIIHGDMNGVEGKTEIMVNGLEIIIGWKRRLMNIKGLIMI